MKSSLTCLSFCLCSFVSLLASHLMAQTFSLNPAADAFVTTGPSNNLTTNNYGGAGGLSIAAAGSSKGEFQSVMQFDLSAAKTSFDTVFGVEQWTLASATLQVTAQSANNAIFNSPAAGQFGVSWMQNDAWTEGTGNPNSPALSGINYNSLVNTFINGGADQNLGTFSFNGATSGNFTNSLTVSSGFLNDAKAGGILSLRLFAADSTIGSIFLSRTFGTVASRPLLTLTATTAGQPPFSIQTVAGQSNRFTFSFPTTTGRIYLIESASKPTGYWIQETNLVGTGSMASFTNLIGQERQFFRIESRAQTNLALFPALPLIHSNVVSLSDAVAGAALSQEISPGQSGFPPYQIQFSNNFPDGVSATVISNNTAQAKIVLTSTGTLTIGERKQFAVWVTDAQSTTITQRYDLRVVAPAPTIVSTRTELKAGATANLTLEATNGVAPFRWNLLSGVLPEGITFATNGTLSGTPTAAAAEFNENGLYTNVIAVTYIFSDRVTSETQERTTTTNLVQRVRLSYALNVYAARPNGPSLGTICIACHGSGFAPNFDAPNALLIINETSGSGGECDIFRNYIEPGNMFDSLIWQKVHDDPPACGIRMPATGDYLSPAQINRLGRWITELTNDDVD